MTNAEKVLASRLLDVAANEFHEHGCNDMDPEYFEDLDAEDIQELVAGFNEWHRGETGETCGAPEDKQLSIAHIGDDMWMAYLAAVIGRSQISALT